MTDENATFHSFKPSGKWRASARGVLTPDVFATSDRAERRERIVRANGGKFPGLSGRDDDLVYVVIADEEVEFGYPLMLFPS
jgi:hypothetical protein